MQLRLSFKGVLHQSNFHHLVGGLGVKHSRLVVLSLYASLSLLINYYNMLLLWTAAFLLTLASADTLPDGWHLKVKAPLITSYEDLMSKCQSNTKHIFLDFFTPGCPYCYQFMDDFNRVYD